MSLRRPTILSWVLVLIGLAGCSTVHEVTIDAISDPAKAMGSSYHLEVNDPTGGVNPEQHNLAVGMIKDALAARGLFEVPADVRADMAIEASYGVGHGYVKIVTEHNMNIMLGASGTPQNNSKAVVVYDKTLELTARAPDTPGTARAAEELWNVRAKIADPKQELTQFLPALASACIDYIGENPGRELTIPVESGQAQALLQQRPPTAVAN